MVQCDILERKYFIPSGLHIFFAETIFIVVSEEFVSLLGANV